MPDRRNRPPIAIVSHTAVSSGYFISNAPTAIEHIARKILLCIAFIVVKFKFLKMTCLCVDIVCKSTQYKYEKVIILLLLQNKNIDYDNFISCKAW